jgi:radical SAM superfamily enzyme YgiQ (UPF0313 family)
MQKKGLLIAPAFPSDSFWSYRYIIHYVNRKAAFPPLGLITFAALMPKNWDFELIDMNVCYPPSHILRKKIEEADAVFVGAMSIQKKSIVELLAGPAKGAETPWILGGPFPSTYRDQILSPKNASDQILHDGIDLLVWGEAQNAIDPIIHYLNANPKHTNHTPHLIIPGKVEHSTPGSRKYLNDRSIFKPLELPPPRWDLVNVNDYRALMMQTTAGCKFRCDFCDIVQFNGGFPRAKTTENIKAELKAIYETGHRGGVFIVDDNIMGIIGELSKILDAQIEFQREYDYPFQFFVQSSVDIAKDAYDPIIEKFKFAGYDAMFFGIENPDPDALKQMNKKQNNQVDLYELVKKFNRIGVEVHAGFIFGGDHDTPDAAQQIVNFVKETDIFTAMTGMLTPLPHTPLYQRLKEEGRLLEAEFSGNNTDDDIQFVPKNMTIEEMRQGIHSILESLYHTKELYRRAFHLLEKSPPHIFNRGKFQWTYIKAAFLSCLNQGIKRVDPHYFLFLSKAFRLDWKQFTQIRKKIKELNAVCETLRPAAYNPDDYREMISYAKDYLLRYQRKMHLEQIQARVNQWVEQLRQNRIGKQELAEIHNLALQYLRKRKNMFHYPGAHLVKAFELAVKGFHYEQVMKQIVMRSNAHSSARLLRRFP